MMRTNTSHDEDDEDNVESRFGTKSEPKEDIRAEKNFSGVESATKANMFPASIVKTEPIIEDMVLQQTMMQMKHQHILQQQLMELNKQMLASQHEQQLGAFIQQMEEQRRRQEEAGERLERPPAENKFRLDVLKQKDKTSESAVASPEVKRRLQEVILQRKRREAAASMGNLQTGIPGPPAAAPPPPTALLRKVQSESNLLKIKNKRDRAGAGAPYSRAFTTQLSLVPETSAMMSEASTPSPISTSGTSTCSVVPQSRHNIQSSSSMDSGHGSDPASPGSSSSIGASCVPPPVTELRPGQAGATGGSPIGSSPLNSKSLPNIPSSLDTSRRSPPAAAIRLNQRRNPLEKSHSYAILPLRKHLMQKTMLERRSVDDSQYSYMSQDKLDRTQHKPRMIRPLEEVMEEDQTSLSSPLESPNSSMRHLEASEMEVEADTRAIMKKESASMFGSPHQAGPGYFTPYVGPIGRSGISPLVLSDPRVVSRVSLSPEITSKQLKTGIGFHSAMLKHQCHCGNARNHPENPERLQFILARLMDTGLLQDCEQVSSLGTLEQIQSCHTEAHSVLFGTDVITKRGLVGQDLNLDGSLNKLTVLPCGGPGVDSDTYWNEAHTATAARYAAGSVVELVRKIANNQLQNGFGIVRPPGHHAEAEEAMGFCYFNSVAIAAKQLLAECGMRRVLIVDWAIHHGNGTQKVFYEDPRVLYISIHRHDNGNFYPGTGSSVECGAGLGLGTNVNIAWSGGLEPPMGDAEYLAAFRSVVMPIAREFDPEFVLVSAGFDAARGHEHPIGGYTVSPACFAYLTHQLVSLAGGKVALVLEGGYSLDVLCDAAEQCSRALMAQPIEKISHDELGRAPCHNAVETLQKTLAIQSQYWASCGAPGQLDRLGMSHFQAWGMAREADTETLTAMAGLSMRK